MLWIHWMALSVEKTMATEEMGDNRWSRWRLPAFLPRVRGKPSWAAMDTAYTTMLDFLAPIGPEDEASIDDRRAAMKGAVTGNRSARRKFAVEAARTNTNSPHSQTELRDAIQLWQWAYRQAERNARNGHLTVHQYEQTWDVTEPLSGIGVRFYPTTDRHIDSTGGSKGSPTILRGRIAGDFFGRAEYFIGVGIGRWVYLRGAQLVQPRVRWPIVAGLRAGSGSPHVRAWLHAQQPYWWAPVRDDAGNASCARCGQDSTSAGIRRAWEDLAIDAEPADHPLVPLPRRQWTCR